MNLVQINERLKDLPMQVVQQYANGMNPEVPPYLALGELQRREISQKQMAATQGGAQGPQPSIKEQVEQKAGLMALQQMQQQQMQQQQPSGPMPAPAGVPQPQAQPQAPQPEMMARGGLAGIPVRRDMFEYARGGIIAFAEGGDTMGTPSFEQQELASQASEMAIAERNMDSSERQKAKLIAELEQKLAFLTNAQSPKAEEVRAQLEAVKSSGATSLPKATPASARPSAPASVSEARATAAAGPQAAVPPANPRPAATRPPVAAAPAPAAAAPQTGLPAAMQDKSPYFAQMDADLARPITAPTPEGIISQQKALTPEAMQEDAMKRRMEEQRARATGERAAFEKSRPSGLDDLIRVFGQAGQYKGLSGTGPAYTANQQQKRAEELAMERRQNELLNAIDTREYEGAKEVFGARSKSMDAANTAYQNQLMTRTKSLADVAGVDQRRMDEAANRLTQVQIEKLRIAARAAEANRPGEAERIEARYMSMVAKGQQKEADEYLERITKIKGGAGTAGVGADNAQTRKLRDAVKDIDSRLEFMDPKAPEFKTLQAQRDRLSKLIIDRAIGEAGAEPAGGAPAGAIDALRKNPGLAAQFDQKYGKGAAAQYLQK